MAGQLPELHDRLLAFYQRLGEAGLTYRYMAEASGLSYSTMAMWLTGHRRVTKLDMLVSLLRAAPRLAGEVL